MYSRSRTFLSLSTIALLVLVFLVSLISRHASAQAPTPPPDNSFPGTTTAPIVKSQMWINDGTWWGVFSDGSSGLYVYQKVGNDFIKGALVDSNVLSMPDTLWDGTNLYVLVLEGTAEANLYKYSYLPGTQEYLLEPSFPVTLPLSGLAVSAVITQDTAGKLWVTYAGTESGAGGDSSIHVIWSTSDHLTWDTTGLVVESGTASNATEASTIVAFNDGSPKVGVLWSNQTLGEFGFRYHVDGAPEFDWSPKEIVDSNGAGGSVASEYMSIQAAPDGRVLVLGEDQIGNGSIRLYVRSLAGTWSAGMPTNSDVNSQPSRPILLLDTENDSIYCVFRDSTYNKSTFFTRTSLSNPGLFSAAGVLISSKANDGTSTKQHLNSATDLVAAASQDGDIFWNVLDLSAPPTASFIASPTSGDAPLTVTLTDTSTDDMGIVSWNWNFGDGFTSTQPNPIHVFRAGSWDVALQVTDATGYTSTANQLITANDVGNPVIQAITPATVNLGSIAGDFTLIVDGAAFVNGAVVRFDGSDRVTTFVSSTRLTATITLADVGVAGVFPITVFLPSTAVSNAMDLTVSGDNPAPTISSISPVTTTSASPPFDLTVNGTGFVATSKIWINGTERATIFISPTQLTTNISAADLSVPLYQIPVSVVNAPPGGGTSNTAFFDITPACTAPSAPITFQGITEYNSVHSQLWYNDGSWWGAISDTTAGVYFWQQTGNQFVKGAQIGTNPLAAPDTLWNGTNLFVLTFESSSLARFHKYSYDSVTKTYTLLAGFPVDIPLTGLASSLTFAQDSTGKIWATYTGTNNADGIGDGMVHVIWTTSPDHLTWDTTGTVLASGLSVLLTETATITPFGGDKIGISWSNQASNEVAFRYHLDSDIESSWSLKEVVDSGPAHASEYLNLKGLPDGRVFLAQIDNIGNRHANLFRRNAAGLWDPKIPVTRNPISKPKSIVVAYAETSGEIFVIYRDSGNSSFLYAHHMTADSSIMPAGCPIGTSGASNPSSTKQSVSGGTGLAVAAQGSSNEILAIIDFAAATPPTITSIAPDFKTAGDLDFTLTVLGTGFDSSSIVRFNGNNRPTTFVISSQLTAQITAADIAVGGLYPITVSAPGQPISNSMLLSIDNPPPVLSNISPANIPSGSAAFNLIATGSNFNPGSTLRFNGVDHPVTFVSTTEVHAQIAAAEVATPGVVPVEIFNSAPGGGISATVSFTIINTGPTLTSLTPASTLSGGPAFTLTVDGTNFSASSVVLWNGVSRNTTFVSSTQLTAEITAADIQSAGSFAVTVSNSGGTPSNALNFTVNNPLPQITAITPTSVSSGGPSFTLTVNGTGFVPGSVVRFNGDLPANERTTVFDNNTQLTATITAADIAATGTFPITVFTPLPGGGVSNAINLTVENPAPIIVSLTPASVTAGAADFTLTVNGSNFSNNSVVRVDGIDSATTFVSSSALSVQILAAKVASPGAISIVVFNPGAGTSNTIQLQILNPQPIISSISPVSKTAGDAGFTLSVSGSDFNNSSVARLSGNDRPTTFVSSSQLDVQLSAADLSSAGLYPITVFNPAPGGGTSSEINLTVNNPAPVIANLAPANLLQGAPATQVTVNGTGFVNGSVVAWNGQSRSTTFVSPTQLNFQVTDSDLNVEGVASVTVNNPAPGGGNSAPSPFSVNMNPRRVSVVGSSGFSGGSASVTIQLTAQGDENALGFTLFYDTAILSNPTVSLGADSADASLNINTSEVGAGHYGVALSLPAGMTFSAGTRQVVIVNFDVAAVPSGTQTQITFGDQPITREVANITAEVLPTAFVPGSITVSDGVEADVAPRPNGSGNGMVTVSDWVQIGRFVAGIDTVASTGEMQRADCAPRSSLGNGALTISDWVQAGRYAAALDTVLPAGGPMTMPSGVFEAKDSGDMHSNSVREPSINVPRSVRMTALQEQGRERSIAIELDSYGTENGLGFSLMFDPSKLRFRSAENGANAKSATLQINQASADKGRLGVALALPVGHSFNAGTNQIVILKFIELQPEGQPSGVTFTDLPIKRELVSVDAGNLVGGFDGLPEVNSLDNSQYFVYRQYLDLLGRLPDSAGLDYWTEQISACGTDEACVQQRRVAVSNAFLLGREFQQTSGFILRMYRAGLGIRPTYAQFIKERSSLMTGMQIEKGKTEFANYLVQLPDFELLFPRTITPTKYVDGLNANTGNALTPSQRAAFIDGLQSGNESRASVLRKIADNPVFADREFNSSFVLMQYFGYLKRDPDAEGFAFWLDQLVPFGSRAREAQRAMVWSFITSSDYQMRFSSAGGDCRRSGQNRDCLVEPGIER